LRRQPRQGGDAKLILGGAAALLLAVVSYLHDWGLTRMAAGIAIGWLSITGWMILECRGPDRQPAGSRAELQGGGRSLAEIMAALKNSR
jgi:hypothetical protein